MSQIQPIRGMNDVLPTQVAAWQWLESVARELLAAYGYEEIRVPVVEQTQLFRRAIGEFTDVVEKEMYSFVDQGGEHLTLRPEATAGIVRAMISNGLLRGARHRLWFTGPMFRHEKPQKGRFRQFHQVDVEAIGFEGPDVDAELIALTARLWKRIGITRVSLNVNSLGTPEARRAYRELLVAYFRSHHARLDEDSRRRLEGNPLRILDSKNPEMQAIVAGAPLLTEHLDPESRAHFDALCAMLRDLDIPFTVNPRLVRGLDYYSRTVFEWITDALGSQDAVCSGGRYDGLISQLGGDPTPAIGFAMGVERVVALIEQAGTAPAAAGADVYLVAMGDAALRAALRLAEALRDALPGRRVELNVGGGNFKAQFRRADRSGARLAVVIGEDELARGVVQLKPLRDAAAAQVEVPLPAAPGEIGGWLARDAGR
ncbi:MAG: histidine--tRNA ligase [Steroidobacteraceae bacterium]|jgi:histidyl-tRNA synthetase|nr:histidine--tRNA ligase [Steroidobacteraceae bacterium]